MRIRYGGSRRLSVCRTYCSDVESVKQETEYFTDGKPWLLNFFDQIKFYPCSADEILQYRDDFLRGKFHIEIEETTFNLGEYKEYLESIKESP